MDSATLISCASTPTTAAGVHPLEEWLSTQSPDVQTAHSYKSHLEKIEETLRQGIDEFPASPWTAEDTEALIEKMALEGQPLSSSD